MAITEGTFTAAELASAVQTNPALVAELKTFGTQGGFHIRTADEETEHLKNYETNVISKKTSEFANGIEKDIQEIYGEPKLENEKYHDYLKRVGGARKQKLDSLTAELAEAKKGGSETDKNRVIQLEKAIQTEKQTYTETLSAKDKEIFNLKAGFEIEKHLNPLRAKYLPGVPEAMIQVFEQNVVDKLMSTMKIIDGVFVFTGEDGNPELGTDFKPKSIEAKLAEAMSEIIDKGRQQGGAGSGGTGGQDQQQSAEGLIKDTNGIVTEVASVPAEVKTKVQLTEYLMKLGLPNQSKVYNDAFIKFGKDLPLK